MLMVPPTLLAVCGYLTPLSLGTLLYIVVVWCYCGGVVLLW